MSEDEPVARRRKRKDFEDTDTRGKKPAPITPGRIILWCIMAAMLAILFVEWRTRENYNASVTKLGDFFEKSQAANAKIPDGGTPSPDVILSEANIRAQLAGSPHHVRGEGNNRIDTYTWKFFLKRYSIQVQYGLARRLGEQEAIGHQTLE